MTDGAEVARQLMARFVAATGVAGESPGRRYLWTDAFAVCNLLGLHRETGEGLYLDLALRLVDQVHHVLGRHRPDDERSGWISGLEAEEAERHPTRGGLRIGKELPERRPGEPFDPHLEWERDGQYFHYLTQWVHALERVRDETGQEVFHRWAVELALAAHAAFTVRPAGEAPRMVWKMSIGLDRALVPSMGHQDPLDALVSYLDLATRAGEAPPFRGEELDRAIADAEAICAGGRWTTEDALGIGGLLVAVHRLGRLVLLRRLDREALLEQLLEDSVVSLGLFARRRELDRPAEERLAFRELGLAIGLHSCERLAALATGRSRVAEPLAKLLAHRSLAGEIEGFWSDPLHRQVATWTDHCEINRVMLATSLAPGGYLGS